MRNIVTYVKEYLRANWKWLLGALLMGLLAGYKAHGATITATWTNPTQNTDGTSIPATGNGSLTGNRLEYGTCVGTAFGTKEGEVSTSTPATTMTTPDLPPGSHCVRVYAKNTYGNESGPSGTIGQSIAAPTPKPPILVTVAVAAYDVKFDWRHGIFELDRQVGTVALNTPCSDRFAFGDYAMVSPKAVMFTQRVHPAVVVAKCAKA